MSGLGKTIAEQMRQYQKKKYGTEAPNSDAERPEDVEATDLQPGDDIEREKKFARLKQLLGYAPKG